jgi:chaperonin GroES
MFYPMNDFIYVKTEERKTQTESGLHLPESTQDPCDRGVILATGPDVEHKYFVGDTILFARHSGTVIREDGEENMILHEESVYGVIA